LRERCGHRRLSSITRGFGGAACARTISIPARSIRAGLWLGFKHADPILVLPDGKRRHGLSGGYVTTTVTGVKDCCVGGDDD
jgi:hypothetical protein